MHPSQIIFSAVVIFIIYRTVVSYLRRKISKLFTLIWLCLWLFILSTLFNQYFITWVAGIVGIGRGVDVAVYASVIVIFYLLYVVFVKLNEVEAKFTEIVRKSALEEVDKKSLNNKNVE